MHSAVARCAVLMVLTASALVCAPPSDEQELDGSEASPDTSQYITIPSSGCSSINESGAITGYLLDAKGNHGMLRQPDGTIITFDPPGSSSYAWTNGNKINNSGTIVGTYLDTAGYSHGYIRSAEGVFTTFDAPNSYHSSLGFGTFANLSMTLA